MVTGIAQSSVESTPRLDPSLGQPGSNQQDSGRRGRSAAGGGGGGGADTVNLSPEAQQQISQLQQRDREVRSHEQSHISAGGAHVNGGATYTYQRGPDNRQYAIGGSVSIDTSAEAGNPEATKAKARQVRSAALAPGNPSAQDQSVAAQASTMEMQAQQEAQQAKAEEGKNSQSQNIQGANPLQISAPEAYTAAPSATAASANITSRAAAAYQLVQQQGSMPTALAPWGTGIAMTV